jgi:L-arabinokinase
VLIAFYVSGHGWGHASRDTELMNAIGRRAPDVRFIVRSTVAPWFFARSARVNVDVQPIEVDTGVAQIDSLSLDEVETARCAAGFYRDFDRRAAEEAAFLRRAGCSLVLADIPPLAFAAAARAGIPSVAVGNFTWDWIYADYPAFNAVAPEVIPYIRDAYARAHLALRLPMHGGFDAMGPVVRDVPFIARHAERAPAEARHALNIPDGCVFALVSFGSYGPELKCGGRITGGDLIVREFHRELPNRLRYEDVVAAADVVVSKPGYGIIADCVANGTSLLYAARGHFVEYDVMVAEMPRVLRCRQISQEDLLACRWQQAVRALLAQPPPPEHPRTDGAAVATEIILGLLNRSRAVEPDELR